MAEDKFYLDPKTLMMPKPSDRPIPSAMSAFEGQTGMGSNDAPRAAKETSEDRWAAQLLFWGKEGNEGKQSLKDFGKATLKPITDTVQAANEFLINPDSDTGKAISQVTADLQPKKDKFAPELNSPSIDTSMFAAGPAAVIRGAEKFRWMPKAVKGTGLDQTVLQKAQYFEHIAELADLIGPPTGPIAQKGLTVDLFPDPIMKGRWAPSASKEKDTLRKVIAADGDPDISDDLAVSFSDLMKRSKEASNRLLDATPENMTQERWDKLHSLAQLDWLQTSPKDYENAPLFVASQLNAKNYQDYTDKVFKIRLGVDPLPAGQLYELANRIADLKIRPKKGSDVTHMIAEMTPDWAKRYTNEITTDPEANRWNSSFKTQFDTTNRGEAHPGFPGYMHELNVNHSMTMSEALQDPGMFGKIMDLLTSSFKTEHRLNMEKAFGVDELGAYRNQGAMTLYLRQERDPFMFMNVMAHEIAHGIYGVRDPDMSMVAFQRIGNITSRDMSKIVHETHEVSKYIFRPSSWLYAYQQAELEDLKMLEYLTNGQEPIADALAFLFRNPDAAKKYMPTFTTELRRVWRKDPKLRSIAEFYSMFPIMAAGATLAGSKGVSNENPRSKQSSPPSSVR